MTAPDRVPDLEGADETVLAGDRTAPHPSATGVADARDAAPDRPTDAPLPTAAGAVVPRPEQRERYQARLLDEPPPAPAEPAPPIMPAPHADGEHLARRAVTNRRRQAAAVIAVAVAVPLLALAALALVLLL